MSSEGNGSGHRSRWLAVSLSGLVHAGVVAALAWGWWTFRAPRPAARQLAIEATVVLDRPATVTPAPTPPAATIAAAEPAAPEREQAAQHRQEQRAEEQARREHEKQEAAAAAAAAAAAEAKLQQEAAARKSKAAEERAAREKAKRESELRAQLAAEERINAARSSAEAAAWLALIRDRVNNAWIRPPSARAGVNCEVYVTQVPGGVVTAVQIGSCNGDAAVRESIEAAVYRASPLPTPSNQDLFDRSLKFNFHPDE